MGGLVGRGDRCGHCRVHGAAAGVSGVAVQQRQGRAFPDLRAVVLGSGAVVCHPARAGVGCVRIGAAGHRHRNRARRADHQSQRRPVRCTGRYAGHSRRAMSGMDAIAICDGADRSAPVWTAVTLLDEAAAGQVPARCGKRSRAAARSWLPAACCRSDLTRRAARPLAPRQRAAAAARHPLLAVRCKVVQSLRCVADQWLARRHSDRGRYSFILSPRYSCRPAAGENMGCACAQKKLSYHT
ncbi:hypothetical protein XAP6164_2010006 [Xanthomonas phaseoli pv. phaseoli]|nr:hypothetical protein XAP6164_2010006 [Xanthomonas phaseoli pv. phaseoli]